MPLKTANKTIERGTRYETVIPLVWSLRPGHPPEHPPDPGDAGDCHRRLRRAGGRGLEPGVDRRPQKGDRGGRPFLRSHRKHPGP